MSPDYALALVIIGGLIGAVQCFILYFQTSHTGKAASAAQTNAVATMLAERAYVDMSHGQEGLKVEPIRTGEGHSLTVKIGVKNHGHTPADVQSVVLDVLVASGPLPETPPYAHTPHEGAAFLMPGQGMVFTPKIPNMADDAMEKVKHGEADLYLLGYVDYVDKFGRAHRGGYARRYDRHGTGTNNLAFVTKRGYNYDREISEDKGAEPSSKVR